MKYEFFNSTERNENRTKINEGKTAGDENVRERPGAVDVLFTNRFVPRYAGRMTTIRVIINIVSLFSTTAAANDIWSPGEKNIAKKKKKKPYNNISYVIRRLAEIYGPAVDDVHV